jgi:hypothetical protein
MAKLYAARSNFLIWNNVGLMAESLGLLYNVGYMAKLYAAGSDFLITWLLRENFWRRFVLGDPS